MEKLKQIKALFEEDEKNFRGFSAMERLHESAPEDYIESRIDWNRLSEIADDMYYMLVDILGIISSEEN